MTNVVLLPTARPAVSVRAAADTYLDTLRVPNTARTYTNSRQTSITGVDADHVVMHPLELVLDSRQSSSNPFCSSFSVSAFSVTVRIVCSENPSGLVAWISIVTSRWAPWDAARC